MSLTFIVGEDEKTADQILKDAPKIKRPPPLQESFHKGFRVEGHPPGAMEKAKEATDRACAEFNNYRIGKPPQPWSEAVWRQSYKKRPVRAKPYEIPEAAKVCADMATRAGWLDIVVVEIKREVSGA